MNASIRAQYKHEATMREVRMNGQITEVKQLLAWKLIGWVTIYDAYILSFSVWL